MNDISKTLVNLRRSHNYTKKELAIAVGVSIDTVEEWEDGDTKPSADELMMLSNLYHVSLEEIINSQNKDRIKEVEEEKVEKTKLTIFLKRFPYPVFAALAYLLCGFLLHNWTSSTVIFFTVPLYYSIITCIEKHSLKHFAFPVFITGIYLFLGLQKGMWHPLWLLFITIPLFYSLFPKENEKKEEPDNNDFNL